MYSSADISIVRNLAQQVAEIARSEDMELRFRRWRDANGLRKPDRAPVYCRPVGAWKELLPDETLLCRDPYCRGVEKALRMVLIKEEIGDDSLVEPFWDVPVSFDIDPPGLWGLDVQKIKSDSEGGAWHYDPPLKNESDFDKLRFPTYALNAEKTEADLNRAHDLLGDILPVRKICHLPSAGLGGIADSLRGMGQLMLDMVLEPELVHRLMSHLRDGILGALEQIESIGEITGNNNQVMTCSDPIQPDCDPDRMRLRDLWLMTESQEFDSVSPAMWEEFLLDYQKPIIERFGLSSYGCCENLTKKIDGVLSIPNLRIFVCSAWSDLSKIIEAVGDRYVVMIREKATDVTFSPDMDTLRRNLEEKMEKARGAHVQIVLRELQTLDGRPRRLHEWTEMAKEVAEKYAGESD